MEAILDIVGIRVPELNCDLQNIECNHGLCQNYYTLV